MDDEARWYFIVIVQTVSLIVLWMLINILCGLYFGLALFSEYPTWKNYIYYPAAIASLVFVIQHLAKKWKTVKRFER